jgi:RNase P/RNase MRP subunit p29
VNPGDYFVAKTGGVGAQIIRAATRSRVNHAGVVVDPTGRTIEAHAGGADYGRVPAGARVITPRHPDGTPLTPEERARIVTAAVACRGVPYNWTGLAALAAAQYGLGRLPGVETKLSDLDDLFCSQLVDFALHQGGVILFDDGRPFGKVSPGDLDEAAAAAGWTSTPVPGRRPPVGL